MQHPRRVAPILHLALVSSLVGCASPRLERNKQVVLAQARAYNERDMRALRATVTPVLSRHCQATPDVRVRSDEDFVAFLESDLRTFPDGRLLIDRLVAEGDLVGAFGRFVGTQQGALGPFPASGKQVELEFGATFRIEGDRVAEIWITWDNLAALTQLGHWPPDAEPGPRDAAASTADTRDLFLRYLEASNAHDLETLASMTADGVVWHLGPYELRGRDEALLPNEGDAVLDTSLEARDVRVEGRVVECELIERNDVLRAVGIESWRHHVRYVFDETGRVVLKEPWRPSPDDAVVTEHMQPFRDWVRANHPESVPDFGDMTDCFGAGPARRSLELVRGWIAAGRPGDVTR